MSLSTSFQPINKKIMAEDREQLAAVDLRRLLFSDSAPATLLAQAAAFATQILPAECCLIWELQEGEKTVVLRAAAGLEDEGVSRLQTPLEPDSLEGYTLSNRFPVVIGNIPEEARFKLSRLIHDQGLVSGSSQVVGSLEHPLGILEVFSSQAHAFHQKDIDSLQSIADVAGILLQRKRREENLEAQNQLLRKELETLRFGSQSTASERDRIEIKNRLIDSRERERLRLAQDLHDSPIQDLYGLIYQLDDLRDGVKGSEVEKIVDECDDTLHRVVNSLRSICRELRPPSLSPFGLEVAIRDHVEKFREQNPGIHVHLNLMRDKQVLSDRLRLGLFRIYQEAIQNVARHAQATEIRIRFYWNEETIILEVEDNGRGFEVPRLWVEWVRQDHFGLAGIVEQAESMGGNLEIVSAPENGTRIRAIVPLS
jgi:signal transduction histidine kinase